MAGMIFVAIVVIALGVVIAWNTYPPFKAKMASWTTLAEGALGFVIYLYGMVSEGIQEAMKAGYVPKEILPYLPLVLFAWFVVKRLQTKTPVGKK